MPINLGQSLTAYVDSAFGSAVIAWLAATVWLRHLDAKRLGIEALVLGWYPEPVVGVLSQPVGVRQIQFVPENL